MWLSQLLVGLGAALGVGCLGENLAHSLFGKWLPSTSIWSRLLIISMEQYEIFAEAFKITPAANI